MSESIPPRTDSAILPCPTRRKVIGSISIALASLLYTPPSVLAAESETGRAVVERLHDQLLATMKAAVQLGVKGRYERLAPEIKAAFDLPRMIQAAVGADWQKATPQQRENLTEAFTRISVGTYARRFDGYSGESFKTAGERPGPNALVLVDTQIVRPNASPVALTYVTRATGVRWQIVDVLLDSSVSELAVRRSEYRRIVAGEGLDALIAALRAKATELLQD